MVEMPDYTAAFKSADPTLKVEAAPGKLVALDVPGHLYNLSPRQARDIGDLLHEAAEVADRRPSPKVGDQVSTVEELDALPIRSAVLGASGLMWQKWDDGWEQAGSPSTFHSWHLRFEQAPLTVLHVPA